MINEPYLSQLSQGLWFADESTLTDPTISGEGDEHLATQKFVCVLEFGGVIHYQASRKGEVVGTKNKAHIQSKNSLMFWSICMWRQSELRITVSRDNIFGLV